MKKHGLKAVNKKMGYDDYLKYHNLSKYSGPVSKALRAYSDCYAEIVADIDPNDRDLDFFSTEPCSIYMAKAIFKAACPYGYNGFEAEKAFDKIEAEFGNSAIVHVAREGSVCVYIKPIGNALWLSRENNLSKVADEVSFEPSLSMFRLWWD